ncbi:putative periostin, partial [Triplophysa rosa]
MERERGTTKLTRVIKGKPSITKVTRVIEGHSASSDGELDSDDEIKKIVGEDVAKMRTFLDGEVQSLQDEDIKKISDAITAGGGGGITTITQVVKQQPQIVEGERVTTFTRVIKPQSEIEGGPGLTTFTRIINPEPQIIEGPDFSKMESFSGNQDLIDAESERITRIIKEGRSQKRAAIRQPQ